MTPPGKGASISPTPGRVHVCASAFARSLLRYSLLSQIASRVKSHNVVPKLDRIFLQAQTWEALSIAGIIR